MCREGCGNDRGGRRRGRGVGGGGGGGIGIGIGRRGRRWFFSAN